MRVRRHETAGRGGFSTGAETHQFSDLHTYAAPMSAAPPLGERLAAVARRVISSLPGVMLVLDEEDVIRFSSGSLEVIGRPGTGDLVGSRLVEFVDDGDGHTIADLIRATRSAGEGATVGPARISYFDAEGARRSTEAWGANLSRDPDVAGVCLLLLPETAYDRFDHVLMRALAGASLEQVFGALAQALRFRPVEAESFFLMPRGDDRRLRRSPDLMEVPGPPLDGPWDEVWHGTPMAVYDAGRLPAQARLAAAGAGFASVTCMAIGRGDDGQPEACLVVWTKRTGPLLPAAEAAVERAAVIAALAISHDRIRAATRAEEDRDPLTGLATRERFVSALESRVSAGEQPAVIEVDLDCVDQVSGSFGSLAGDAVVRVSARRLASVMRPTDELASLGEDRFGVLCDGMVSGDQAEAIAGRLLGKLNEPVSVGEGRVVRTAATAGIVAGMPVGTPADTVIAQADWALTAARTKGPGSYSLADVARFARSNAFGGRPR